MICTHRIYKGEDVEFHIPFDVEDYTNLQIEFTTNGDYKVEAEEWAIEDGVIYVHFYGGDLDILPDGVIRETLTYELDGEDKVEQYTTNLYLKTPVGYSAMTPQDIYESGYTAGQEDCSGYTDCSSAITEAYQSGYTAGYEAGQAECSGGTEGKINAFNFKIMNVTGFELPYIPLNYKFDGNSIAVEFANIDVPTQNHVEFSAIVDYDADFTAPTSFSFEYMTDAFNTYFTEGWEPYDFTINGEATREGSTITYRGGFPLCISSYSAAPKVDNPDITVITINF